VAGLREDAAICVTSFDWQGRKQLLLTVDKLPLIQSYGGTLDLIYNSKRHPFKLTIERADLPGQELLWKHSISSFARFPFGKTFTRRIRCPTAIVGQVFLHRTRGNLNSQLHFQLVGDALSLITPSESR
jgi:hypothetical protein